MKIIYHPVSEILLLLAFAFSCRAQEVIPLYSGPVPNAKNVSNEEYSNAEHTAVFKVSHPTLSVFLPPEGSSNGTAVIICPGGGYHELVIKREGSAMAQLLTKFGITAFVLKYRLPEDRTMINKSIGPLQDAQQAIKLVRENKSKWHINPHKVGILGFSAGGHVASTAGTHFNHAYIKDSDDVSLRPDFMILVYPVISMTYKIGHKGSRINLLGENPPEALIREFSNEFQVTPETPPAFIVQAQDDSTVPVENSVQFYEALHKNKVPVALHIFQKGGHGFSKYPPRSVWVKDLIYWMKINGWLPWNEK